MVSLLNFFKSNIKTALRLHLNTLSIFTFKNKNFYIKYKNSNLQSRYFYYDLKNKFKYLKYLEVNFSNNVINVFENSSQNK